MQVEPALLPRDRGPRSHGRSAARSTLQAEEEGRPSTHATALVQAAIQAWEGKDADTFASYLSDDLICKRILPQPVDKAQLIAFMQSITTAFPDWSFNGHVLHEASLTEQSWNVLYVTTVTGTHTGDLIVPPLPDIEATGRKIILSYRHLEALVAGDLIAAIDADFSPSGLEEVLAQLGLELP
ncbi:MAG TPA: nuclear transport factor 2 family protein [Ktedonosporobacter sp.]|nr:nuclear transport factor 2 family protein [Ktedonosporobacter sp.]